jgi:hypothetical protein
MSTPTTRGKYRKLALGEGLQTWGLSNGLNGLFDQMDAALHGHNLITLSSTSYTLTSTNYTVSDINYRFVKFAGTPGGTATITIPATENWWLIQNSTGETLTFSNGANSASITGTSAFYGIVVTDGSAVSVLTLPDGVSAKTIADNIASVNQVATDSASVIAVAAKSTEVGRLGTADAVADMALLGTTANVAAQALLGTSANVTAQGHLGTAANVVAQGHLGTAANVIAQGHLGTSANVTAMGNLGTSANVTNMANLSPQAVRDDMAALGTSAVRADMAALAETDVLADMAALGDAAVITDLDLLGTTANVTAMGHLGTSANVTAMGHLGTTANVTAQGHLGTSANVTAMGELGTSANVTAMGHLGTSANVTAMGNLGTTQNVTNMSNLGTSQNVTNMGTLAPIAGDITTTAGVSTAVTAYSKQYSAGSGDISTRADGTGTVAEGDLRFRTDTDTMRVYNGTAWEDAAPGAGNYYTKSDSDTRYAQVSNNLSDVTATTARTNLGLDPLLAAKAPLASPTFTGTLASPTINASTALQIGGVAISASAAELNYNDVTTLGTTQASKTVTADANGVVTFDNGKIEESTAITSSSNAATINLRDGDNFTHTLSENVTYTFSNPAANGKVSAFTLKVTQDSTARTITWPASVDWAAATAPTLSTDSGAIDVFVFTTYDGGTTYYGFTAGQAMG